MQDATLTLGERLLNGDALRKAQGNKRKGEFRRKLRTKRIEPLV